HRLQRLHRQHGGAVGQKRLEGGAAEIDLATRIDHQVERAFQLQADRAGQGARAQVVEQAQLGGGRGLGRCRRGFRGRRRLRCRSSGRDGRLGRLRGRGGRCRRGFFGGRGGRRSAAGQLLQHVL